MYRDRIQEDSGFFHVILPKKKIPMNFLVEDFVCHKLFI